MPCITARLTSAKQDGEASSGRAANCQAHRADSFKSKPLRPRWLLGWRWAAKA
jgi:hypothetical protein